MKRFSYRYESTLVFSSPVAFHSWLLRCQPRAEQFQKVEQHSFSAEMTYENGAKLFVPAQSRTDSFGSAILYGFIYPKHSKLNFVSQGTVQHTPYRICGAAHSMYSATSPLTVLSEEMERFARNIALDSAIEAPVWNDTASFHKAAAIVSAVHRHMSYVPGSTNTSTTAADAFASGQGVCQDYAHITISLLRHAGIPARYACGFIPGEGATHAWVEFFDRGVWLGIDPTHDRLLDFGSIKIAHGRDCTDCPVNRGVFTGKAEQETIISLKVTPL